MRDALFWIIVLALGAGLAAWLKPEWFPEAVQRYTAPERVAAAEAQRAESSASAAEQARVEARAAENPPLYQWRDDQGQLQVTDRPPKGRPYEIKRYDPNASVIPVLPGAQ